MTPTITYGPWLPFSFVDRCARLAAMLPPPLYLVGPDLKHFPTDADLRPGKIVVMPREDVRPISWRYDPEAVAIGCVAGWISEDE